EPAADDGAAQLPVDLAAEVLAADEADMEVHAANLCAGIGLVDSGGIGSNAGPFPRLPITHERIVTLPCLAGRPDARQRCAPSDRPSGRAALGARLHDDAPAGRGACD